ICRAIVETLGNPLISTSLHDTSDDILEYFSDPGVIYRQYEKVVDLVVDGGFGNIYPSTVIDCSGDEIVVVREGLGNLNVILCIFNFLFCREIFALSIGRSVSGGIPDGLNNPQ